MAHAVPLQKTDWKTDRRIPESRKQKITEIPESIEESEVSASTTNTLTTNSRLKKRPIYHQRPKGKAFTVIPGEDHHSLKGAKESPNWPEWECAIQIVPE